MPDERCETCAHYREPGIELDHLGQPRMSKWHRCARLFVVTARERPGREKGHVLPVEALDTLAFEATATALHVAPHFVCEQWTGHDGRTLIPVPTFQYERDQREALLRDERLIAPERACGEVVPREERDGWGLRRRMVVAESGDGTVAIGREHRAFVLMVPGVRGGPEGDDPGEEAVVAAGVTDVARARTVPARGHQLSFEEFS